MKEIKIFTDSSIDLPGEVLKDLDLSIVSMNINLDNKEYVDLVDIDSDFILDYGDKHKKTPKTSCPTFQQVEEILSELGESDYGLFLLISSKSSSSTHLVINNVLASKGLEDRVAIIDSKSLSGGLGLLAIKARELVDCGYKFKKVVKLLNEYTEKISTSFVIDTLDYLYYGGRCSQMTLIFAGSLKIKPMVSLVEGDMKVVKKYRGNLTKVLGKYVDDMISNIENINSKYLVIAHTRIDQGYLDLVLNKIKQQEYFENIYVTKASATITSHAGANTVGLFYSFK